MTKVEKKSGNKQSYITTLVLISILGLLSVIKIESTPPLWWDEGWTMSVARNWVELGHYGLLLNGTQHSAGLSGHFPVVASVALSFKLLGIGIWQARLPFVLFTLATSLCLILISGRIYSRNVAWGTMFVLVFMTGGLIYPPLIEGRQVLGEMPSIFFFLLGLSCLSLAMEKSKWYLVISCIVIGISAHTKAQMRPFIFLSLTLPIIIYAIKRNGVTVRFLFASLVGTLFFYTTFNVIKNWITSSDVVSGTVPGLINVTGFVPVLSTRVLAVFYLIILGIPLLIGVLFEVKKIVPLILKSSYGNTNEVLRLILLIFVSSWIAWYLLLAMWWTRYLYPALVVGSIYISSLMIHLISTINLKNLRKIRNNNTRLRSLIFVLILLIYSVPFSIYRYFEVFTNNYGSEFKEIIDYLNIVTPKSSVIETY